MHPILEFIYEHLDHESFSGQMVWESVKGHTESNTLGYYTFACTPCQTWVYPCDRLREVAAYFADEENYDETWTPEQS